MPFVEFGKFTAHKAMYRSEFQYWMSEAEKADPKQNVTAIQASSVKAVENDRSERLSGDSCSWPVLRNRACDRYPIMRPVSRCLAAKRGAVFEADETYLLGSRNAERNMIRPPKWRLRRDSRKLTN